MSKIAPTRWEQVLENPGPGEHVRSRSQPAAKALNPYLGDAVRVVAAEHYRGEAAS